MPRLERACLPRLPRAITEDDAEVVREVAVVNEASLDVHVSLLCVCALWRMLWCVALHHCPDHTYTIHQKESSGVDFVFVVNLFCCSIHALD
jgi:hypothetical protein